MQSNDVTRKIVEKVELLLSRGASPQSTSVLYLHYCILWVSELECPNILVLLMKAGADPWAVDDSGQSVTEHAYNAPIEGWRFYSYDRKSHCGNRGMIWEQALTACGYNAAEFRQSYLDAGGRLDRFQGVSGPGFDSERESAISGSDQDSESEGESNISYEVGSEEPAPSGPREGWVTSSTFENEQRRRETQDSNSYSATGSNHVEFTPREDNTQHRASENTDFGPPPFAQSLEETRYWQNAIPERSPVAESSGLSFQNPSGTASTQHNNFPLMDAYPVNTYSWTWDYPGRNYHEAPYNPPQSMPDNQIPHPQAGNAHWSYTSTPHQSETPQPKIGPRIQELDLLQGDANVWGS